MAEGKATSHPAMISVVITTFNRSRLVARAVASVLAQTLENFELLVVDDGSTDDTEAVLSGVSDPRFTYRKKSNEGVSAARNFGARLASRPYLVFLDSDDEVQPAWLETLLGRLVAEKSDLVFCGVRLEYRGGRFRVDLPRRLSPLMGGEVGMFLTGCFAMRRDLFHEVGGYDPRITFGETTELAIRLFHRGARRPRVSAVSQPLLRWHREEVGPKDLARMVSGVRLTLEKHEDLFPMDPRTYQIYLTQAGVGACTLGDYPLGRGYLWRALRVRPANPRSWFRLFLSCVPWLGNLFWRRSWGRRRPLRLGSKAQSGEAGESD